MGRAFKDFYNELVITIPRLSSLLAKPLVNRAWHDIQNSRQWSFLKAEGVLYSPQIISSGTFTVTFGSNVVVADATAIAALNGVTSPALNLRQIRFGSGANPVYSIVVIDPAFGANGKLYLDRIYEEASATLLQYRIYRCYYGPPQVTTVDLVAGTATTTETSDFLRWNDIYNPLNSRWFIMPVLAREMLNRRDPKRSVTGNIPYWMFAYKNVTNSFVTNTPYFELWPHPTAAGAYPCSYQRRGLDFVNDTDTLPTIIPDALLMERAMFYACEWASKNQNRYMELKGTNWKIEQQAHKLAYSNISSRDPGLLEMAQRDDEEAVPQNMVIDARSYNIWPLGDDDLMVYANINP